MSTEIDKTVLVGLQKVLAEKDKAYWDFECRRRARESELMTEIRDRLAAEFGAEAEIVNKAKREAGRACRAEMDRIREIESAASLPYLEGTKLVEWGYPRWSSGCPMSKTGEVAILEIFKKDDEVPVNCRRNMPDVGAIVLRILKKDGSKGLKVKCWNDRMKGYWFPEGVDPNAKKA